MNEYSQATGRPPVRVGPMLISLEKARNPLDSRPLACQNEKRPKSQKKDEIKEKVT